MTRKISVKIYYRYLIIIIGGFVCAYFQLFQTDTNADNDEREVEILLEGPLQANNEHVISILRTKYLDRPSTKSYNLSQDPSYAKTKKKYSWSFIYSFTKRLFESKKKGFFIEAGALDGEFLSNTLWLEQELQWTGLLVEPDLLNYRELLYKNRKCWSSNSCLSSEPYPKSTTFNSRRGTVDTYREDTWIYRGSSHEEGYTLPPGYDSLLSGTTSSYMKVQCFPLYSYLLALNRTSVDFISLDIQGSEMDVIRNFPFSNINVDVFVIEHIPNSLNEIKDIADFANYFSDKGYDMIGCGGEYDFIFVRKNKFKWESVSDYSLCNFY